MMKKRICYQNQTIQYELCYKKVKNINLRIRADGSVYVSANKRVSEKTIETFLLSKGELIVKALEEHKKRDRAPREQYFTEEELKEYILFLCKQVYPYYKARGISYPQIKFRNMVSRWGSCHPVKGILTFTTNLMYAPCECIRYVVLHEFTHFLQGNHSKEFYRELEQVCPHWKECRKQLKEIRIR